MFTVCPKCALTLVVTAADLRVAQGYVRCGRCSSVFNALARLSERQAAEAEAAPATQPSPPAPAPAPASAPAAAGAGAPRPAQPSADLEPAPEPATESAPAMTPEDGAIPEAALEFNPDTTDVNSVFVAAPPHPEWTAATGSFRELVAGSQPAASDPEPSVDVEIDTAFLAYMLDSEAPAPEAQTAAPTVPVPAARPADAPAVPAPAGRSRAAAAPTSRAATGAGRPAPLTEEEAIREAEELASEDGELAHDADEATGLTRALARLRPLAWPVGTALAALLLVGQIVNHYRDELAASARFNHPLTALYGSLGISLFPHWDLRAYDVRQLGASGDAAGAGLITVRASIKNGASQPQPLPLLRVTLQDRFGNRIAARDVAPKAYLPTAMPASSFLSAGQRIDAQMGFADPGPDAVGFEIDACLPAAAGVIACANDSALR